MEKIHSAPSSCRQRSQRREVAHDVWQTCTGDRIWGTQMRTVWNTAPLRSLRRVLKAQKAQMSPQQRRTGTVSISHTHPFSSGVPLQGSFSLCLQLLSLWHLAKHFTFVNDKLIPKLRIHSCKHSLNLGI